MSRRLDPTYFEDGEDGWEPERHGGQYLERQSKGPAGRRPSRKAAYHGSGKRSRQGRDGWGRFDD